MGNDMLQWFVSLLTAITTWLSTAPMSYITTILLGSLITGIFVRLISPDRR